jgi:hypothetical protein
MARAQSRSQAASSETVAELPKPPVESTHSLSERMTLKSPMDAPSSSPTAIQRGRGRGVIGERGARSHHRSLSPVPEKRQQHCHKQVDLSRGIPEMYSVSG